MNFTEIKNVTEALTLLNNVSKEMDKLSNEITNKQETFRSYQKRMKEAEEKAQFKLNDAHKRIQKGLENEVEAIVSKSKLLEIEFQNNTLELNKLILFKHKCEGIVEFMGGIIPEQNKTVLPETLPIEHQLVKSINEEIEVDSMVEE